MNNLINLTEYQDWLSSLKLQIKAGQIKAALSVNSQMIMLYYDLGRQIVEKLEKAKWGSGFIEQLSKDLKKEFPEVAGLSVTNLNYCKRFFAFYSYENKSLATIHPQLGGEFESNPIAQIPWGHQKTIIDKCKSIKQALFYINKTIENNWSRAVLEYQIETDVNSPIGVSTFHYTELASDIKSVLPSAEDLQHELLNFEREHKRDV